MTEPEQLALIPAAAPKLTDRQQAVHDALQRAGNDGLTADECGAIAHGLKESRWAHGPNDRCLYCPTDGRNILHRLAQLGLVTYRRANRARGIDGAWIAVQTNDPAGDPAARDAAFGEFPEGF